MACVNHPDVAEVTRCGQCGRRVCQDCFVTLDGVPLCGSCKSLRVRAVERGDLVSTQQRQPSPWEKQKSFATLLETLKLVLFQPKSFFQGLALEGQGSWSFLVAVGWPALVLAQAANFLFQLVLARLVVAPGAPKRPADTAMMLGMGIGIAGATVVLGPLFLFIGAAVRGSVAHLFLRMVGGANARVETSMRVAAYAQSPIIINWIPFFGPVVGGLWDLALFAIGLKEMHETTYGRVIAAILLPIALCGGFFILMIVSIGFMTRGFAR
jgi:hypothetical protein